MQKQTICKEQDDKAYIRHLAEMDETTFFTESTMFLLGKMQGLMDKTVSAQEFQQCKKGQLTFFEI